MALPFFYSKEIQPGSKELVLNEETSKHIVQVLRMQTGEKINLTDGLGNLFLAEIVDDHRKKCVVNILSTKYHRVIEKKIAIGISPLKNNSRFEWFLEKATELGIYEIFPLLCDRTEKTHARFERMQTILISAMLQSQQTWLPVLHQPIKISQVIEHAAYAQKFIAHCVDESSKKELISFRPFSQALILIGPEGDFSSSEISAAINNDFIPVSLGHTRLRTETAGLVSAALLCNG